MNIITFIFDLMFIYLIPIILFIIGGGLSCKQSKEINSSNGYSSAYEKKSKQVWSYAQKVAPKIIKKYAIILGVFITMLLAVSLLTPLEYRTVYLLCTDVWIMIVSLIIYIMAVERKLRIKFDNKGRLRV